MRFVDDFLFRVLNENSENIRSITLVENLTNDRGLISKNRDDCLLSFIISSNIVVLPMWSMSHEITDIKLLFQASAIVSTSAVSRNC